MKDFTHLHLHTEHSLLDGINRVETLPEYIKGLGQTACAMTDHGTVSGTYRFFKSCRKAGIKPILGMEAYYAVGDRSVRDKDHLGKNYHHLVLLALNNQGLHNLYKLSSHAYTSGMYYKPRIDDALISEYSEGVAATSACLGSYSSQLILRGETKAAEALLDHHGQMFKDRFFIEVQLHPDKEQQLVNQTLLEIAKRRNWPLLLTNDCLLPGQPIMTNRGAKPVEEISAGDMVLTDKGRYRPVVVPVQRTVNESIYHLELKQCKKSISLTGEHPVLISDKEGNTKWTLAKDIRPGHLLTFPRQKLTRQNIYSRLQHFYEEIDSDLAWLLGWFTAEGSTWIEKNGKRYGFNFALSLKEKDIAERIQKIIQDKFHYTPKVHVRSNWIEVRGYHGRIAQLLAELCGIGSRNKYIHETILKSDQLSIYLKALFQGDRTATRTSQLATASFSLAYGVKQALANLGYWGNVSHIKRKCQTGIFDQYLISWTPGTQHKRWLVFDSFIARCVQSIRTETYIGLVFNFEVAQDNTYVSEVTVHNCHYTHPEDKQLHEESLCMQTGAVMSDPPYNHEAKSEKTKGRTRFSFGDIDVHVAHHDWMWEHAQTQGIPYEAISNTMAFAAMVDDSSYFIDRKNRYPHYQKIPNDLPPWEALLELAHKGLRWRMGGTPPQEYIDRINREYKIIKKMGYYHYLFIVRYIQNGARDLGVMVGSGRGSAAGSLVAWALRITEVDPIKYGLVFERWLNMGRAARPLLLSQDMIKKIKELPNGSSHHDTLCSNNHSHGHGTVSAIRSVDVRESSHSHFSDMVRQTQPRLSNNLLKCFEQGISIKV